MDMGAAMGKSGSLLLEYIIEGFKFGFHEVLLLVLKHPSAASAPVRLCPNLLISLPNPSLLSKLPYSHTNFITDFMYIQCFISTKI